MTNINNTIFTLKVASPVKKERNSYSKIGKKCSAVVIEDNGELKARLVTSPVKDNEEFQEYILLPFTNNSFKLKGKTHVFLKEKDKYNHHICVIRDSTTAIISPGVPSQYDALHKGLLVGGHVIRKNGKNYFNYEELIAYNERGGKVNAKMLII